jgi:hypothetical protein
VTTPALRPPTSPLGLVGGSSFTFHDDAGHYDHQRVITTRWWSPFPSSDNAGPNTPNKSLRLVGGVSFPFLRQHRPLAQPTSHCDSLVGLLSFLTAMPGPDHWHLRVVDTRWCPSPSICPPAHQRVVVVVTRWWVSRPPRPSLSQRTSLLGLVRGSFLVHHLPSNNTDKSWHSLPLVPFLHSICPPAPPTCYDDSLAIDNIFVSHLYLLADLL